MENIGRYKYIIKLDIEIFDLNVQFYYVNFTKQPKIFTKINKNNYK